MLRYRKVILAVSVLLVVGPISVTVGTALRWSSAGYRRAVESRLSNRLHMPVSIGSIEPLSLTARRFVDISLMLPRLGVEVFRCAQADWRDDSHEGVASYSLDLDRGWLLVGADEWDRSDYREMLRSGLGHDFSALHLREIRLRAIDLVWRHEQFAFTASECSGQIRFDDDGAGRASVTSETLNGTRVAEPINIVAHFTPGSRLRFHKVVVDVPRAPLSAIGLDALLGARVTRGTFVGQIVYRDTGEGRQISVGGGINDALLSELTKPLPGGPYDGEVNVELDEARFVHGELAALRFSGSLDGLKLEQIGVLASIPPLEGSVDLRVHQASYENGRVEYFSAEGSAIGLSLSQLSGLFGGGLVTGTMSVTIDSLLIVDGQLSLANITLRATPPEGRAGTIDRSVLREASLQLLGFDATTLLPPGVGEIEYTQLGVRLVLNRGELRVFGTHGDDGRTILTVKLFGREFGVVKEPRKTFAVDELLAAVQQRVGDYDAAALREWWGSRRSKAADGGPDDSDSER